MDKTDPLINKWNKPHPPPTVPSNITTAQLNSM